MRVSIDCDSDVVAARQKGRELASQCGFPSTDTAVVATAISELARNIVLYAKRGEVVVVPVEVKDNRGLIITARDEGEGIADIRQAMQDGYSTSGRLGVGLPGVKRLMDEFEIVSEAGKGTTVIVKKWMR